MACGASALEAQALRQRLSQGGGGGGGAKLKKKKPA
jgi:hypothetical protein